MEFKKMLKIVENDRELKKAMDTAKNKEAFIHYLCRCFQLLNKGLKVPEVWNAWTLEAN